MQNLQPNITIDSLDETNQVESFAKRPKIDDQVLRQNAKETTENDFLPKVERWDMKKASKPVIIVAAVIAITAGVATGWGAKNLQQTGGNNDTSVQPITGATIKAGDVFGSNNEVFKDSAEGYLEKGGIDGEGSHKLLRSGGVSQTVYLTSSVTDLDKFIGMEIKVWGETYQGQQAGWLMDVGKIEVINSQGTAPVEAE